MTGYARQDISNNISNGSVINADDLDLEFNAVEAAFNGSTGHTHDGTTGNGAPINVLGPGQDVLITTSVLRPKVDNTVDLGTPTLEFKDLYIDGVANIDSLVADTADINGGTVDGVTIATSNITVGAGKTLDVSAGTLTLADNQISGNKVEGGTINGITITTLTSTTGNVTNVNATTVDTTNIEVTSLKAKDGTSAGSIANTTGVVTLASSVLTTTDINGGTIDGATIATSNITVGTGKTLDVSAGTLTLADNQISGDKVEGGTINAVTITTLTSGTVNSTTLDTTNLEVTNLKAKDGTSAGSIANTTGIVTLASSVLTTADINGGTIDGTVIGGTSAAAVTGTTGTFSGDLTVADKIVHSGDTNTSIRFPAADTFTVETSGSERLRVTSAGDVGIGTASPTEKLDVVGNVKITGLISGTAVTQTAIDTTTGRLIKTGDFGIGVNGDANILADLDAFSNVGSGFYRYTAATIGTYPPGLSGTFGTVICQRYNATIFRQTMCRNVNDGGIWARVYNGTAWTRWTQVFTQETLLGTVSQASGVPTGSVFERGSNANGEYVRSADGTQICTFKLAASTSAGVTWTFPAAFSSVPVVQGNAVAAVLAAVCIDSTPSTTAVVLSVRDKVDARRADVMHLVATGRWF